MKNKIKKKRFKLLLPRQWPLSNGSLWLRLSPEGELDYIRNVLPLRVKEHFLLASNNPKLLRVQLHLFALNDNHKFDSMPLGTETTAEPLSICYGLRNAF